MVLALAWPHKLEHKSVYRTAHIFIAAIKSARLFSKLHSVTLEMLQLYVGYQTSKSNKSRKLSSAGCHKTEIHSELLTE